MLENHENEGPLSARSGHWAVTKKPTLGVALSRFQKSSASIFAQIFENPQINLIKNQVSQLLDGD